MTGFALVLGYAAFAAIAIFANLVTQRLVLALNKDAYILAVLGGTAIGLVLKYVLDKTWVFKSAAVQKAGQVGTFALYVATGVITTLIFWGFETTAWLLWQTHQAREAGAVVGLLLGYMLKYWLDRRYVFAQRRTA